MCIHIQTKALSPMPTFDHAVVCCANVVRHCGQAHWVQIKWWPVTAVEHYCQRSVPVKCPMRLGWLWVEKEDAWASHATGIFPSHLFKSISNDHKQKLCHQCPLLTTQLFAVPTLWDTVDRLIEFKSNGGLSQLWNITARDLCLSNAHSHSCSGYPLCRKNFTISEGKDWDLRCTSCLRDVAHCRHEASNKACFSYLVTLALAAHLPRFWISCNGRRPWKASLLAPECRITWGMIHTDWYCKVTQARLHQSSNPCKLRFGNNVLSTVFM